MFGNHFYGKGHKESNKKLACQNHICYSANQCNYEMKIRNLDVIAVHVKPKILASPDTEGMSSWCQFFKCVTEEKVGDEYKCGPKHTFHHPVMCNPDTLRDISNSSLKEIEKEDLKDELTSYMKEIKRREDMIC
ncbi:hypothetical protein HHI36_017217 [Cryptolaemus montrouzieri]|uniref:Uncharacterized protein n=1 Tax=Cryptolaemus montrouzieri TaxID=559131 RepID=A0ABD2NLV4_9CUCU